MDNSNVLICIVLILSIIILIWCIINKIIDNYIIKNSDALKSLNELNANYIDLFYQLQEEYYYHKRFNSKQSLYNANFNNLFKAYFLEMEYGFINIPSLLEHNCKYYQTYINTCACIFRDRNTDWYKVFNMEQREKKIFDMEKLNPVRDVSIIIHGTYTSPKGKNHYSHKQKFDSFDLVQLIENINKENEYKKSKEYQRTLMTSSLRYDILKRDNFKCVLCGATAKDGAALHVDHIIPVSKGGKTESSNLRTLCDQCNLGKRDKYDDNGMN